MSKPPAHIDIQNVPVRMLGASLDAPDVTVTGFRYHCRACDRLSEWVKSDGLAKTDAAIHVRAVHS